MEYRANDPFDDFTPGIEPEDLPFGKPVGSIPMGTLANVMGAERAKPILDMLEESDRLQARAVFRILGRSTLYRA